jgi:hypothetical protein
MYPRKFKLLAGKRYLVIDGEMVWTGHSTAKTRFDVNLVEKHQ